MLAAVVVVVIVAVAAVVVLLRLRSKVEKFPGENRLVRRLEFCGSSSWLEEDDDTERNFHFEWVIMNIAVYSKRG